MQRGATDVRRFAACAQFDEHSGPKLSAIGSKLICIEWRNLPAQFKGKNPMSITFYTAPFSSASPVACALTELKVPHERVTFDLTKSNHKTPEFLALNPNGR